MQRFCGFFHHQAVERPWNPWTGSAADSSVSEAAERSSQWIWIKRKDACWAQRTSMWPAHYLPPNPHTHLRSQVRTLQEDGSQGMQLALGLTQGRGRPFKPLPFIQLSNLMIGHGTQAQAWSPRSWPPLMRVSSVERPKHPLIQSVYYCRCVPKFRSFPVCECIPCIGTMDSLNITSCDL